MLCIGYEEPPASLIPECLHVVELQQAELGEPGMNLKWTVL